MVFKSIHHGAAMPQYPNSSDTNDVHVLHRVVLAVIVLEGGAAMRSPCSAMRTNDQRSTALQVGGALAESKSPVGKADASVIQIP
jgi:hypothetical protein